MSDALSISGHHPGSPTFHWQLGLLLAVAATPYCPVSVALACSEYQLDGFGRGHHLPRGGEWAWQSGDISGMAVKESPFL